jgi:Restriction endonuclease
VSTPSEKGNALESAVAAIEHHILSTSPNLHEKTFLIESNKIVIADGVRHEIDVFVTIDLGDGYKSVFIFECKNWKDAVGKNEIIIFEKKIEIARAQYGYFVAKSFTKDAESQAATNDRTSLLRVSEFDPTTTPRPFDFHTNLISPIQAGTTFFVRGGDHAKLTALDPKGASAALHGSLVDLCQYLNTWAKEASENDVLSFRSERETDGDYEREVKSRRDFALGEFIINGSEIEHAESFVRYNVHVVRPAIVSHFEVESRGRFVSFAPIQVPSGHTLQTNVVVR